MKVVETVQGLRARAQEAESRLSRLEKSISEYAQRLEEEASQALQRKRDIGEKRAHRQYRWKRSVAGALRRRLLADKRSPPRARLFTHSARQKTDSRWVLDGTSPSGKQLFRCSVCGRTSQTPDKECPRMECMATDERIYALPLIDCPECGITGDCETCALREAVESQDNFIHELLNPPQCPKEGNDE